MEVNMTKRLKAITCLTLLVLMTMVLTSCVNDTTYPGDMNIIEASEVLNHQGQPHVIVVDVRGQEAYDKGHLEGAILLSPSSLVVETPVPQTLVSKKTLEAFLGDAGISNEDTLYLYDDNNGVSAARVWWSLKVYGHKNVLIVNGGASALVKAGATLTLSPTTLEKTTYTASEADQSMMASYEEVKAVSESEASDVVLLDVRSTAEFAAGYIPGAINYAHTRNLYSDGTFLSSRDMTLFYRDLGLDPEDDIIVYCKSSFRAAQTVALLQEAGYTQVRIYDGAWIEWEQKEGPAVPVEETAPITEQEGS
jgi:thiosulfate/3-mercaptopyruvate sulfurtransferase